MDLVIFDLDGTLIDSRKVMTAAFQEAFDITVGTGVAPLEEFYRLLGDSFPNILARLGLPAEMAPLFKAASQRRKRDIVPIQEAIAACETLYRLDVPLAVLTGKDRERTTEILEMFGMSEFFGAIAAGSDGFAPKPAPDGVLLLAEQFGCPTADTRVVGDSTFDVIAARRAGAKSVACAWGMAPASELLSAEPDLLLTEPAELLPHLLGSDRRTDTYHHAHHIG